MFWLCKADLGIFLLSWLFLNRNLLTDAFFMKVFEKFGDLIFFATFLEDAFKIFAY
jgi:hypothetical protein